MEFYENRPRRPFIGFTLLWRAWKAWRLRARTRAFILPFYAYWRRRR